MPISGYTATLKNNTVNSLIYLDVVPGTVCTWSGWGMLPDLVTPDPNWTNASNWTATPANGNMLTFPATGLQQYSCFNNSTLDNVGLVTFDSGGSYTIGGNALKLNVGILNNSAYTTWGLNSQVNTTGTDELLLTSNAGCYLNMTGTLSGTNGIAASGGGYVTIAPPRATTPSPET